HQDLAELHDLAGRALDLVDPDHVLGGDAVLLAAGSDDCEHGSRPGVRCRRSDRRTPACFSRLWALRAPTDLRTEPARAHQPIAPNRSRPLKTQVGPGRLAGVAYGDRRPNCQGNGLSAFIISRA